MKRSSENGFSLLEMVLVVGLLGLLTIATVPLINSTQKTSLTSMARALELDLRYAQTLATTTNAPHGFRAVDANTYEVFRQTGLGDVLVTSPHNQTPMSETIDTHYPGVSFNAPSYPAFEVVFQPNGAPSPGGGTQIQLQDSESNAKTIIVSDITGRIEVQ